ARSQILLSNWLRIPTLLMEDYEYSQFPPMIRPTWALAPTVIPDNSLCCKNGHVRKYPGIKEHVYAWQLNPDPEILKKLGSLGSDRKRRRNHEPRGCGLGRPGLQHLSRNHWSGGPQPQGGRPFGPG